MPLPARAGSKYLLLELATCARDVIPAILANEGRGTAADENVLKAEHGLIAGSLEGNLLSWIQRDEIHFYSHAAHQTGQRLGISSRIGLVFDHNAFEHDALLTRDGQFANYLHDGFDRVLPIDRHQLVPDIIRHPCQ